jgi:hypothetical protein
MRLAVKYLREVVRSLGDRWTRDEKTRLYPAGRTDHGGKFRRIAPHRRVGAIAPQRCEVSGDAPKFPRIFGDESAKEILPMTLFKGIQQLDQYRQVLRRQCQIA